MGGEQERMSRARQTKGTVLERKMVREGGSGWLLEQDTMTQYINVIVNNPT